MREEQEGQREGEEGRRGVWEKGSRERGKGGEKEKRKDEWQNRPRRATDEEKVRVCNRSGGPAK